MKFVQTGGAPREYLIWCREVKGTDKEDYRELPSAVKALTLETLVGAQGEICPYTMKRIDTYSSHIEHIMPESLCRTERKGSDLDFSNLLACFPRGEMPRGRCYGARQKGGWWDPSLFISPLNPVCEQRFRFKRNGSISVVGRNTAASKTIHVLALDHKTLTEDRCRAIEEFIYGPGGKNPLSRAEASRLRGQVCSKSDGRFVEFCVALRDALDEHIAYIEKLARKRTFARKEKQ